MTSVVNMIQLSEVAVMGLASQPNLALLRVITANACAGRQIWPCQADHLQMATAARLNYQSPGTASNG